MTAPLVHSYRPDEWPANGPSGAAAGHDSGPVSAHGASDLGLLHGADDGNRTRVFSLGIRPPVVVPALTCWRALPVVTVADRGRPGRIARSSHGPCSSPAS